MYFYLIFCPESIQPSSTERKQACSARLRTRISRAKRKKEINFKRCTGWIKLICTNECIKMLKTLRYFPHHMLHVSSCIKINF